MVFIHTIASLIIMALGVAAFPAPAPQPEAAPILVVDFEPDVQSISLNLLLRGFSSATSPSVSATQTPATPGVSSAPPTSFDVLPLETTSSQSMLPPAPSPIITCETIRCIDPYVCMEQEGVPGCYEKESCGKVFCPYGTRCCNSLCDMCAPSNMSCIQGCTTPETPLL
ncbi:uncharacterized protein LY79DRAFT_543552 [Colletotrichum navitas]|uniref:Uncharacterized protein n=1 Tax=Colletotrichum navitas TaxID=681940 RepID=A0AAD8V845_9PEZI|nr:uncharacterized protein LY79DRAFT_543552 [Colletotrichum navitas]KAK1596554.1 hypothetical protein LY79DRAFT_543552 [Colletotrichum navitas]